MVTTSLKLVLICAFAHLISYLIVFFLSIISGLHINIWHYLFALTSICIALTVIPHISILRLILYIVTISIPFIVFGILGIHLLFPDHGRYAVYAHIISEKGHWIPWKYPENSYYQFFHVTAYMLYLMKAITGLEVYTLGFFSLTITMYIVTVLGIVVVALRFFKHVYANSFHKFENIDSHSADTLVTALVLTLLLASPPTINYALGGYGFSLALLSIALLCYIRFSYEGDLKPMILFTLLSIIGVILHPVYILSVLTSMYVFSMKNGSKKPKKWIPPIIISLIAIVYWIYTKIMEDIVLHEASALKNLVIVKLYTILRGEYAESTPAITGYMGAPEFTMYAWSLVPALLTASALTYILRILRKSKPHFSIHSNVSKIVIKALIAFSALAMLYYVRGTGRYYLYWFYVLVIPLASILLLQISRDTKLGAVVSMIMLIALFTASFDPVMTPKESGSLALTDRHAWISGITIGKLIPPDGVLKMDMRLGGSLPLGTFQVYGEESFSAHPMSTKTLFIIGFDSKGELIRRRILSTDELMNLNSKNIVFNDAIYRVYT
jgi:hypothetical protein